MTDNEFDIKIRSMLENAAEEVPGGVWEGISASLDRAAAQKRRAVPVFWWRMTPSRKSPMISGRRLP